MNARKLALGLLVVVLAAKTPADAQDLPQYSAARIGNAESPAHRAFRSAASGENAVRRDARVQREKATSNPVSRTTAPPLESSTSPSTEMPPDYDDGCDGCCCPTCNDPCPCVYGQVEALLLKRDPRFLRQPIIVDPNTGTTFLSTSDLDFNFDPGLRATAGVRLHGNRALEFSYFGLFEESASAAVGPDPNAFLIFPGNFVGNVFVDMDQAQVDYSSQLHSVEVNLPCCCGCCDQCGCCEVRCRTFEWFAGIRYLYLGEELNIAAQRIIAGGLEEGAYNIRTTNHLYGAQIGARARRWRGPIGCEATGKAGIYYNDAEQEQSVTDFPNFPLRPTVSSSGGDVAFVGDINLSVLYRLNNVWSVRAGYNALLIEGLALAPDQLDFNFAAAPSGDQLHDGGGMLLHGVNIGLDARW